MPNVGPSMNAPPAKRKFVSIGRPGYQITKVRHPTTRQPGLLFQIEYPQILPGVVPLYRIMAAYEQKVDEPNKAYQYVIVAAEPYDTIAFKVQSDRIDESEGNKLWTHYDKDTKQYTLQFLFERGYEQPTPMFEGVGATRVTA